MKNTMHRVVILNNLDSEMIESAILILKNTKSVCENNILDEAERVVKKYMGNSDANYKNKLKTIRANRYKVANGRRLGIIILSLCALLSFAGIGLLTYLIR